MAEQPLQALQSITVLFRSFPNAISAGTGITWALYALFAFWVFYTLITVYHWLKYSHASWLAFPAIAAHLLISFALISYTLSGNASFLSAYMP